MEKCLKLSAKKLIINLNIYIILIKKIKKTINNLNFFDY